MSAPFGILSIYIFHHGRGMNRLVTRGAFCFECACNSISKTQTGSEATVAPFHMEEMVEGFIQIYILRNKRHDLAETIPNTSISETPACARVTTIQYSRTGYRGVGPWWLGAGRWGKSSQQSADTAALMPGCYWCAGHNSQNYRQVLAQPRGAAGAPGGYI